ncbi:hypothetical protein GCK72_004014 [Caenorhabditis remanei]|uniref:Uncharacterized protein n=1 Tax=Caenorhabditis remanei TaxID=31234 RepID=A0A6A5H8L8_CAERE|nr:hypothetical protein GCK72_004014 [Caenorhabditis remanei]KAF1764068.1 hypothetical protein GCK72_004014 [Caenorhabditis remanei]
MTGYGHTLENFQHPAIQHAETLIMTRECLGIPMLALLQGLRNFEVFWRYGTFTLRETVDFVKHLMEGGREIGSSFTFGISREEFAEEIVEAMHQEVPGAKLATLEALDGCKMFPYVVSIPIDESSELNIFGEETDEKIGSVKILFNFKVQIMEIGTAKDSGYVFEEKMFCDLFSGY